MAGRHSGAMLAIVAFAAAAAVTPPHDDDDERRRPAPSAAAAPARGDDEDEEAEEGRVDPDSPIVVTARRLDAARTRIDAGLGATVYSLTNEGVEDRPGGEFGSLSQILRQAPGVTLSGNALNVRGAPANQVRINNVIVPEAISDPADQLSARLAETTRLITGTLPAQFGFAPAGVISVTTKNGLYQHGGQAELFAGSDGLFEPALEWAGSVAGTSLFASGSLERRRSTLADAAGVRARDRRNEIEGLGFADHVIDGSNRISMLAGGARERHRIGPTSIGPGVTRSSNGYLIGTFQHSDGGFTVQSSLFGGLGHDGARFSDRSHERRSTFGTQIDASQQIGEVHMLQVGLLASRAVVRELEPGGRRARRGRTPVAIYAQDEWEIGPGLTVNPGARLEWLRGPGSAATFEPRASIVWASGSGLTGHLGYARYASAAPLGEETGGAALPDERDDYFGAGLQQRLGALTIGLDGYWRSVRNYLAGHETIGSAFTTAFAFRRARIGGLELSAAYARRSLTAWANLSLARARARTVIGGDLLFPPAVLAAASARSVPLASERPVTASAGLTWRSGRLSLSGDMLASSGAVRTAALDRPNGARSASFAVFGLAAIYHVRIAGQPADLRLDLTNATDARYVTSDAANLEGGWTRQGPGRAIAIGIEQGF
jgi:hypothetical protein